MSGSPPGDVSSGEDPRRDDWHTYRCPVCGHTDGVALGGSEQLLVECSHCSTPLELSLRSEDEERLAVQVQTESEAE